MSKIVGGSRARTEKFVGFFFHPETSNPAYISHATKRESLSGKEGRAREMQAFNQLIWQRFNFVIYDGR